MKPYIIEILNNERKRTRAHLKNTFRLGTGRLVPPNVNLREYVPMWHAQQQEINAGGTPKKYWKEAVGVL